MNQQRDVALGRFEQLVLLAILSQGENAYGSTIRQAIEAAEERPVASGALYTTLERMEGKGLIRSSLGKPTQERGGRAKKFFHLTPNGSVALDRTSRTHQRLINNLAFKEL